MIRYDILVIIGGQGLCVYIVLFWVMTPCLPVGGYQVLGVTYASLLLKESIFYLGTFPAAIFRLFPLLSRR
jgi:hypothetical protein